MFGKKVLGLVTLLFACGLNRVKAAGVEIETCEDAGITVYSACSEQADIQTADGICLSNNVIYSYNSGVTSCYQAELIGSTVLTDDTFHVLNIGAATATRESSFTGEIASPETLAILKCAEGECRQAYGIIKSGEYYYKISKNSSGSLSPSEVANPESTGCTASDIGKLLRVTSGTVLDPVYLCLAAGITAKLPTVNTEDKNYLLIGKDSVENDSAFKNVNLGTNDNGIVIVGQNAVTTAGSETPSMLVFDSTYTVINDCLVNDDLSISGRTDNLCTSDVNCDSYYFCKYGICTESTTVYPNNVEIRADTCTKPTSDMGGDETEYAKCKGLVKVGSEYFNCDGEIACTPLTKVGYFINLDSEATNKYIKCSGSSLSCEEVDLSSITTCALAGNGGLFDDGEIKLCLDSSNAGVSIQLNTITSTATDFFVSTHGAANIFGEQKDNHYRSVTIENAQVVLTTITPGQKANWYKYSDASNKILTKAMALDGDSTSICSTARNSIVEYSIEADESQHRNTGSDYYKKIVA